MSSSHELWNLEGVRCVLKLMACSAATRIVVETVGTTRLDLTELGRSRAPSAGHVASFFDLFDPTKL